MMRNPVAHVVDPGRREDGSLHAITMHDRGERGVLVWAGTLVRGAEGKNAATIEMADYATRETVSFMSWHDIEGYFAAGPYAPLVAELMAVHKRNERAAGAPVRD
ncbi:MAG: hypothetical protein J0L88_10685 [Xanthomonadales bacterium]|nr:hypothetical protein [Xanthomonadales bacterium]